MSTGNLVRIVAGLVTLAMSASITPAISAGNKPPAQVLFTNVNIFDGFSDQLQKGMSVLVEDNHIKEAGRGLKAGAEATVIDGGGRTMTPGLIDMHGHVTFNTPEGTNTFTYEWDFGASGALAAQALRDDMLMKGITTARDIVGNSRGIANAIKKNLLNGPRLYTSGCVLSHTGGHGDAVLSATFSPDGARVVTASRDKTACLWDASFDGTTENSSEQKRM